MRTRLRRLACAFAGVIFLTAAFLPVRYVAVARVLLPPAPLAIGPFVVKAATFDMSVSGEQGSRVLAIEHWGAEPRAAAAAVNAFLRTQLADGITVIDEAGVPFEQVGPGTQKKVAMGWLGVMLLVLAWVKKKKAKPSDRSLVRHALRFAQHGEKTLLIDTGEKLRVVLSREAAAAARPQLKILARLAGGALVVARLEGRTVACARRRGGKSVANS